MDEKLVGGRNNIIRDVDVVYRPAHEWTIYVHDFLKYLHRHGFENVPYPKGVTEDHQEIVSFVDGHVFNGDLSDEAKSDEVLIEFAKFIRKFHDLGAGYIERLTGEEKWMLPIQTEIETMCHGDLAPYNTTLMEKRRIGLIDFDTLHPGSRLWDISYALYRWVPLMSERNSENYGRHVDKSRRVEKFLSAYGKDVIDEEKIFAWIIKRLQYLVEFMKQEALNGDETFKQHIEEGHLQIYIDDIEYIKKNWLNP